MTYPMDEFPQDLYDSVAGTFGPGDVDPSLVIDRARLYEQQQHEQYYTAYGAPAVASHPTTVQPPTLAEPEEPPLLDDQEEAYHYLLRTLSAPQRDALLVLSMRSPANALDQFLGVLWDEFDDERDRGPRR